MSQILQFFYLEGIPYIFVKVVKARADHLAAVAEAVSA